MTKTLNKKAALKFLKKSLKRHGPADEVVTDRLRSYGAALRELGNSDRQETGSWANNRAENSHQPLRRREWAMLRFRRMRSLQKFVAVHASVHNLFNTERHLYSRENFKHNRAADLAEWRGLFAALQIVLLRKRRRVRICLTAPATKIATCKDWTNGWAISPETGSTRRTRGASKTSCLETFSRNFFQKLRASRRGLHAVGRVQQSKYGRHVELDRSRA